jgi:hypothetical protein
MPRPEDTGSSSGERETATNRLFGILGQLQAGRASPHRPARGSTHGGNLDVEEVLR